MARKINIFTNCKRTGSVLDADLDTIALRYIRGLHSEDPASMAELWRTTDEVSNRLTVFQKNGTVKQFSYASAR